MTYTASPTRLAGAAIAAVLALPSTAALAQTVGAPPVIDAAPPSAPVTVMPEPAVAVSAPVAATPPTPPAPVLVLPAEQAAPAVVRAEPRVAQRAAPAAARAAPRVAASEMTATPTLPAAASSPTSASVDPVTAAPLAEPSAAAPIVADSAPAADTAGAGRDSGLSTLDLGLIGGGVAVGGIALVALMLRRRRPDPIDPLADADGDAPVTPVIAPVPGMAPAAPLAPQVVRSASAPVAVFAGRGASTGTAGVGRHEAMVDAGPTADNPFLTRSKRLRRARFLDRQEAAARALDARRRAGEGVMRASTVTVSQRQGEPSQPVSRRGGMGW